MFNFYFSDLSSSTDPLSPETRARLESSVDENEKLRVLLSHLLEQERNTTLDNSQQRQADVIEVRLDYCFVWIPIPILFCMERLYCTL
jgi:hypothetical protein